MTRILDRGWCEIGVYRAKQFANVGTLWRSAYQLGAAGLFTIAERYPGHVADTSKAWKHVPLRQFATLEAWHAAVPEGAVIIGIETGGTPLHTFTHPQRAVYLLGAEDVGLPPDALRLCNHRITIEAVRMASYNVAVAGSLVLYHRWLQRHAQDNRCENVTV